MKILVDMNLSPRFCQILASRGWQSVHWSDVGDPCATDREIMEWARTNGHVVLTHDLDFGAALTATQADGPSVIQVRTQDVLEDRFIQALAGVLKDHRGAIEGGALVVIDESRSRVRILPLQSSR